MEHDHCAGPKGADTQTRALGTRKGWRLAEMQEPMTEGPAQQPRGLTRLDQLVVAKLAEAVHDRTRKGVPSGDDSEERPRKILSRRKAAGVSGFS